ncbi:hypothetical protein P872_11765 [Rhodonellum psychrophilum GCM71 = DSM 17998]|uniref:Glycosyltransferase RgtA/B/C/D-like domain-containing protein n=2 Tax=Rhodonellum TaxID=336827 RepID=U5BYK4_9BACT|nr:MULTISPECIES: hypothetical protein [Rhodonellum]ERM80977.1 hypothetical protein P872_11765 [Rhodonellum psychrophilum GCM71 = DSM 17998]SDZ55357.1 hypothetical protein SAMN05444412_12339 [Rhodonellum ikkaensis]
MKLIIYYISFVCLSLFTFFLFFNRGVIITGDTFNYFQMFKFISEGEFPHTQYYTPGYPFFMFLISRISKIQTIFIYEVVCSLLIMADIIIVFFIAQKFESVLAKFVILTGFFSFWTFKIQFFAQADSIFYTLLLTLIFCLQTLDVRKRKNIIIFSFVISALVLVKYNNLLLIPIFLLFPFLTTDQKRGKYYYFLYFFLMVFVPILAILFWRYFNGNLISHISQAFDFQLFKVAFIHNIQDFFSTLSFTFFSKFTKRFTEVGVILSGVVIYVGVLLVLIFNFFRKTNVNIFLGMYVFLYPIVLILLISKSGHIEINQRTIFPFLLTAILSIAFFVEQLKSYKFISIGIVSLFFIISQRIFIESSMFFLEGASFTTRDISDFRLKFTKEIKYIENLIGDNPVYNSNQGKFSYYFENTKTLPLPHNPEFYLGRFNSIPENEIKKDSIQLFENLMLNDSFFCFEGIEYRDENYIKFIEYNGGKLLISDENISIYFLPKLSFNLYSL